MGYTPRLLVKKKDIEKYQDILNSSDKWANDGLDEDVMNLLLDALNGKYSNSTFIIASGVEVGLILFQPEFTDVNQRVRWQLDDWDIEYATFN